MAVVQHHPLSRPAAPRVSVCIANFNGEAMLADCIDSILAQECGEDVEVLVHDDASSDRSLDVLRHRYPQVSVLASAENVGFCVANNRMAAAARGEYLLLLNNDAALNHDGISVLLQVAAQLRQPAVLSLPQHDWETGQLVDRGCLLDPFHVPVPNLKFDREDVAYVIGACLWIPRTTWNELEGFPDWLGSIAEDMYLCCNARLRCIPVRCATQSGYRHRQGSSFGGNRIDAGGMSTRYTRRHLSERNRLAVIVACTPSPLLWPWLSLHLLVLLIEAAALCMAKRSFRPWSDIYFAAIREGWRNRAHLLSVRTKLQRLRTCRLRAYVSPYAWFPRKLSLLLAHGFPRIR